MSDKLDLTKPLRTRDGRQVRIYATDGGYLKNDGNGTRGIHGAVLMPWGWQSREWRDNGRRYSGEEFYDDLINVEDDAKTNP